MPIITADQIRTRSWLRSIPKRKGGDCRLYRCWFEMRRRCLNKSRHDYRYYGARGIAICPQWNDYSTFRIWAISRGYAKDLTLDRINPNGNYEPGNCRWATAKQQANNRRRSIEGYCQNGHLRSPENTRVRVRNGAIHRDCRRCNAESVARYKARKFAEMHP